MFEKEEIFVIIWTYLRLLVSCDCLANRGMVGYDDVCSVFPFANAFCWSLASVWSDSSFFMCKQPHLQRTKLCDMKDGELDPVYVKKREQLKELVASVIRPKIVQGKPLNGKEFVSFLEQVAHLNP